MKRQSSLLTLLFVIAVAYFHFFAPPGTLPEKEVWKGFKDAPLSIKGAWLAETPFNVLNRVNLSLSNSSRGKTKSKALPFKRIELCRMNLFHSMPYTGLLWLSAFNPTDHLAIFVDREWELVDPVIWTKPSRSWFGRPSLYSELKRPLSKEKGTWISRSLDIGLPVSCMPILLTSQTEKISDMEKLDHLFCIHRELLQGKAEYNLFGYNCGGSAHDVLKGAGFEMPFRSNLGIGDEYRFGKGAASSVTLLEKAKTTCDLKIRSWNHYSSLLKKKKPIPKELAKEIESTIETASKELSMPGVSQDRLREWKNSSRKKLTKTGP